MLLVLPLGADDLFFAPRPGVWAARAPQGNFRVSGRFHLRANQRLEIRIRQSNHLGYRLRFGAGLPAVLDDPGRRPDPLAESEVIASGPTQFELTVDATAWRLSLNGAEAWTWREPELGIPSRGTLSFRLPPGTSPRLLEDLKLEPLPDTQPSFAERFGPAIGTVAPRFLLPDSGGTVRDFASLRGPNGLWLFFLRSVDWCVFCKTQLVEFDRMSARLATLGYGAAVITYDSREAIAHFVARKEIRIPILSDADSKVIDAYQLRNASADGFARGVPHPALLILDARGRVESKRLEEDFQDHLSVAAILAGRDGLRSVPAGERAERSRVTGTPSASATLVRPGGRVELRWTAVFGRGLHAYAPGAPKEFIPVSLQIDPHPSLEAGAIRWPAAEAAQLYGYDQPVPSYSGRLEASLEIRLAQLAVLRKVQPDGEINITGRFRYQACNDRLCFPPETIPVSWRLLVEGMDRERVPEALRKPDR